MNLDWMDDNTYYLCKTKDNHYITMGRTPIIHMWSSSFGEGFKPHMSRGGQITTSAEWIISELTSEEIQWLKRCDEADEVLPKDTVINSYSIF